MLASRLKRTFHICELSGAAVKAAALQDKNWEYCLEQVLSEHMLPGAHMGCEGNPST